MVWRYDTLLSEIFYQGKFLMRPERRHQGHEQPSDGGTHLKEKKQSTVLNLLPKFTYTEALETEKLEFPFLSH